MRYKFYKDSTLWVYFLIFIFSSINMFDRSSMSLSDLKDGEVICGVYEGFSRRYTSPGVTSNVNHSIDGKWYLFIYPVFFHKYKYFEGLKGKEVCFEFFNKKKFFMASSKYLYSIKVNGKEIIERRDMEIGYLIFKRSILDHLVIISILGLFFQFYTGYNFRK